MSTQFPVLSQLGIYRVSGEKQETLIKLVVLSICAILGMVCSGFCPVGITWTSFFKFYIAFSTRLFAVLRFESVIHEFDP
jgi:hypothetical protein